MVETNKLSYHLSFPTNPMFKGVVLFSTEMGVRVYERIGFKLTNARINRYLWRNE